MDLDLNVLVGSDDSITRLLSPLLPSSPLNTPLTSPQTSLHSSPEPYLVQSSPPAQLSSSSPPAQISSSSPPAQVSSSSSPAELPSSSSPFPSPRIKRRRERREQQNEVTVYGLRPRARKSVSFALKEDIDTSSTQANPSSTLRFGINDSQKPQACKTTGRLEGWQLDILQEAFDGGVWCPGDVTVQVLAESLKNRTDKQVRDWFSHRRRKLREAGMSDKGSEDVTNAVEALLLLSRSEPDRPQLVES
ncbi:hypothetical protein Clacol_004075 [Clathrus columnatus]|uniref:Homeobox domain-containing protein n=1 Tax=Clathrus columnatus TaxID=1419009 RepID=A0AAV5AA22_9AGAM|nr:hypothetical protein Clacol_004075 [Clathrus columnatus]